MVLPSAAVTDFTMRGMISLPPLAIVAIATVICKGVTPISCPIGIRVMEILFPYTEGEFCRSNIARFNENVAHSKVSKRAVVVQRGAAEIPETVLTKDARVRPHLAFIES